MKKLTTLVITAMLVTVGGVALAQEGSQDPAPEAGGGEAIPADVVAIEAVEPVEIAEVDAEAGPLTAAMRSFVERPAVDESGLPVLDDEGLPVLVLVPTEEAAVVPGDRAVYRLSIANGGDEAVTDMVFDLAIPADVLLDPLSFSSGLETALQVMDPEAPGTWIDLLEETEDGLAPAVDPATITAVKARIAEIPAGSETTIEYAVTIR
ncbi:hypothetical protein [Defluviimonas salinarum]|uniref:DUF11 domain-containing protein n=1 Tax=Defluviimonas salinarum TaxID=2992147 RepID=A0ABT3J8D6_9RHOB|nr:hypothetical protein [Defluviimonas salinarum]MCW3783926.1 hypothetical protein [Defluviimonas salinarum]